MSTELAQRAAQYPSPSVPPRRDSRTRPFHTDEPDELLRMAMGVAGFALWSWDIKLDQISFSDQAGPLLGLLPGRGPQHMAELLELVTPETKQVFVEQITLLCKSGIRSDSVFEVVWPDGSRHWLQLHSKVFVNAVGKATQVAGVVLDVTQHQRDEAAVAGALRALRTLSSVNEILVRATSEAEFLQAGCEAIAEKGGYAMAWVGFAEAGPDRAVRPVAQSGLDDGYLAAAKISWADCERGRGHVGTAVRTGQTQVSQDVLVTPGMAPWREAAIKYGFRSGISLPLKSDLAVFGVLTLYARERDAFGAEEVTLLEDVAKGIAFGVVTLRARAEHCALVRQNDSYETRLRNGLEETVQAISTALELRDAYTYGHQKRVTALAVAIGEELGLPDAEVSGIKVAAGVHDIGKITIPSEILTKPGRLKDIEYQFMKGHAEAGRDILKDITFPWPIADIVWQHHERLDGSGYPRGLCGDEILMEARVIAVADVVEAMASHRPYRPALGMEAALQAIERGRGHAFDPKVVDACLRLCREGGFAFPT